MIYEVPTHRELSFSTLLTKMELSSSTPLQMWDVFCLAHNQSTAVLECSLSSPTTYFWYRKALDITDSIEDPVTFNPMMTGCLLAAWTIVCLAMIKGIQSSGKIWLDVQVWRQALTQVFFALGLGFGSLIAYSSYNPRGNNCHRDAILVSSVNFLTSLLASLVVFAVLGFRAHALAQNCVQRNVLQLSQLLLNGSLSQELAPQFNVTGGEVSVSQYRHWFEQQGALLQAGLLEPCDLQEEMSKGVEGTGLAFITFTEAMALFPASPFWSFLFFLMLLNLGLSTMFGTMQGILTPLIDHFSALRKRRSLFTVCSCVLGFLLGMTFVLRSGSYFVSMFDDYSATLPLVIVVLFETVGVCWVYGTERFMNDIEGMLGWRPPILYKFLWQFVCVASLVVLLLASLIQMCVHSPTYRAWDQEKAVEVSRDYPGWGLGMLVGLILLASLPIPVLFLQELIRERGDPEQPASLRCPPPETHSNSGPEPHVAQLLEQSRRGAGARHNDFLSLEEEEEYRLLPREEEGLEEYRLLPREEEGLEEYRLLPREEEGLVEYRLLPQEEEGLEVEGSFQRTATTGL
ncbi:sodium-dependent neutral amino acid transporter B(0)AT2-like [Polyodon spathula]|uniref:sodium-dependent neutral amino acid transporter B(0)AT2-like n=1 Tax=Polyodon spathula TaxID=7913 RepID=UPI001B7DD7A9|nr:sodium-dependent neutral amino acid transporter B(0)AT2-like [Polyodon spathula]